MRHLLHIPILLLLLLLASCKPGVPKEFIQPKAMEKILYDYHIALGMAQEQFQNDDERNINERAYKLAVLSKHDVTEEEFEKSLEYYMRHTKEMHEIYEKLTERLQQEAMEQGVSEGELSQYDGNVEKGDTADVWRADRAMVLMKQPPYNHYSFIIKADSSFHKGDHVTLQFNTQYLAQDGMRDAVVVVAMRLANDSVVTRYQHMMSNSRLMLTLEDNTRQGIKEIRGYFMLAPDTENSSTLKLLFLSNIKMTRVHVSETAKKPSDEQTAENEEEEQKSDVDEQPNVVKEMKTHKPDSAFRPQRSFGSPKRQNPVTSKQTTMPRNLNASQNKIVGSPDKKLKLNETHSRTSPADRR